MKATKMCASIRFPSGDGSSKSQVSFQVFERFFDMDQLGIEPPHFGRVAANQVGSKEVSPLPASGFSEFIFAQGELEGLPSSGS